MNNDELLKETYRLAQENNKMLRAMRRHAFWGALVRFVIYAALLLVPLWFYLTYLAPLMEDMMNTYAQIQGTGARASAQFSDFQNMLKQYQELLGGGN